MVHGNNLAGWVADFIYVCLETRWLGENPWFLSPGMTLYSNCAYPELELLWSKGFPQPKQSCC
jgi:hypothetical protein